jgi:Flp pilus assembly protein TadD
MSRFDRRTALAATILLAVFPALGFASGVGRTTDIPEVAGRWIVVLTPPNRGEAAVRMTFEQSRGLRWSARSRPGAARAFVSWSKYTMGRVLGKVPAGGALVYVTNGAIDTSAGAARLRGHLTSPIFGTFYVMASLERGTMRGELRRDSLGTAVGGFTAVRDTVSGPLRDYSAVARNIRRELGAHVFDPRLGRSKSFLEFFDALDAGFAKARDDLDALVAFYSRVQRVGTSHIELIRDPVLAVQPLDSLITRVAGPPDSLVFPSFPATGVAYIYVRRWDQVTPAIERAFARIDSARPHTLILDIRANNGGDNSAASPMFHLFRDTSRAGVFVSKKWFAAHSAPPTEAEQRAAALMTRAKGVELIVAIRERGMVPVAVEPRAPYFGGRVFLLVDQYSGSASEPLAHHLRATGRATLIGTRTAGAMLTGLPHAVGDGWVLIVPEADYYAADGTRLEGNGVPPHIQAPSSETLLRAASEIGQTHAAAGAMVAGMALTNLARWSSADSAFSEALRLGSDSALAFAGRGRALVELKRWDDAFDALERAVRLDSRLASAIYQIGRAAALSGQRRDRGERALREYLRLPLTPGQPSYSAAHWRLGMILQAHGDREGARREYETALGLDANNSEARAALAKLGPG